MKDLASLRSYSDNPMALTEEQRERLEDLQHRKATGTFSKPVPAAESVHMRHAHFMGIGGKKPCVCPPDCIDCPREF